MHIAALSAGIERKSHEADRSRCSRLYCCDGDDACPSTDRSAARLRADVPALCTDRRPVRQDAEADGRGHGRSSITGRSDRMSNVFRQLCGGLLLLTVSFAAMAQSSSGVPVTPDNFVRAESDLY